MVVFDQNAVAEIKAVIAAAACTDGIFFQRPQAGSGFASISYPNWQLAYLLSENGCGSGNAGQVLQKIQGYPLARQDSSYAPTNLCQTVSISDPGAIAQSSCEAYILIQQGKNISRYFHAGDDSVGFSDNTRASCFLTTYLSSTYILVG